MVLLVPVNSYLWHARLEATRDHDDMRQQGEILLRTLGNRARIDADLAALKTAHGHIARNLLDEQSMEVNLGYFYRLEKTTRVRLTRLNQLAAPPADKGDPFKTVQFSMQITGSYRANLAFLRALETGPRLLRIRQCSLERGPSDSSELGLDLTVELLAKP